MPFEKGRQKTGGRQVGTPNKRSLQVAELLEQKGWNPIDRLWELLPHLSPEKAADVEFHLMQYVFPKPKPQEMFSEEDFALLKAFKEIREKSPEELNAIRRRIALDYKEENQDEDI